MHERSSRSTGLHVTCPVHIVTWPSCWPPSLFSVLTQRSLAITLCLSVSFLLSFHSLPSFHFHCYPHTLKNFGSFFIESHQLHSWLYHHFILIRCCSAIQQNHSLLLGQHLHVLLESGISPTLIHGVQGALILPQIPGVNHGPGLYDHLPYYSDWFRDGHMIQDRPVGLSSETFVGAVGKLYFCSLALLEVSVR